MAICSSKSFPGLQIIYVDNMSSDGTLNALQTEFPEVTAISSGSNAGYCGGNNVGIRHALQEGCRYILLLNPDTELFNPDFLRSKDLPVPPWMEG